MKYYKRKLISFIVSITVVFSALSVQAFAKETENEEFKGASLSVTADFKDISEIELQDVIFEDTLENTADEGEAVGSAVYSSEWDSYSANYYYNLLSESKKKAWDYFDGVCCGCMDGTEDISGLLTGYFMPVSEKWTLEDACALWKMFVYSNPQYYFVQNNIYYLNMNGTYGLALGCYPKFMSSNSRAVATKEIKKTLKAYHEEIKSEPSDYYKVAKIYDLVCRELSYDLNAELHQSSYSAIVNKKTVCAGYSALFLMLANYEGIDTIEVTSETHAWNMVRLYGRYYFIDTTNADAGTAIRNNLFLRSKSELEKINQKVYITSDEYTGLLPEADVDSGSTVNAKAIVRNNTMSLEKPVISEDIQGRIKITSPDAADIYYTTDGTIPSQNFDRASLYTGVFQAYEGDIISAVCVKKGYDDSKVTVYSAKSSYEKDDIIRGYVYEAGYTVKNYGSTVADDGTVCGYIYMVPKEKVRLGVLMPVTGSYYKAVPKGCAKVNSSGVITAVKPGENQILVANSDLKVTAVINIYVFDVKLSQMEETCVGHKITASKYLNLNGYAPEKITYRSSKPKVAVIDENTGVITCLKRGSTVITAYVDGAPVKAKYVANTPVISKTKLKLKQGKVKQLKVKYPKGEIQYYSENPEIASVDANGFVKSESAGETIVHALVDGSDLTCTVTVK